MDLIVYPLSFIMAVSVVVIPLVCAHIYDSKRRKNWERESLEFNKKMDLIYNLSNNKESLDYLYTNGKITQIEYEDSLNTIV